MTTRRELHAAALLVRLEKLAALGAIGQAGKAVSSAISGTTTALGQATRGAIGQGIVRTPLGLAAHGAIKAAPYGIAAYAANEALGNPVGKQIQLQKAKFRARMQDRRAVYDPRTGVMY